jgi:predicted alpha/beta-fold hydrolase
VVTTKRERLELPDGDFLDLDWAAENASERLVLLTHGLEGSSRNTYIQGMARACLREGWDVLAWNFRGCSGEPNRLLVSYHSGATWDLEAVLKHALATGRYRRVDLIGFSLGGNMTLKFLGDKGEGVDPRVGCAVTFSVPCHLSSSSQQLGNWKNRIYMSRFLRSLRAKIRDKIRRFPGQVEDLGLEQMRTFGEFDEAYTAPIHGFRSAEDYWEKASSIYVLGRIAIPTLMVNARNDPFLAPPCFPGHEVRENAHFHLDTPLNGGHLGFSADGDSVLCGAEVRALRFLLEHSD